MLKHTHREVNKIIISKMQIQEILARSKDAECISELLKFYWMFIASKIENKVESIQAD